MKTLHNYLTRQVLASLLMTVLVFTFVLLLCNGLKEILPLLIRHEVRPGVVFEALGLLIPFVLVFALPMGLLTATLLVFGRFSADQELTAARAGGVSLLSLVTPVLLLSLLCCGFSAWINMDYGPRCRVAYKNLIFKAQTDLTSAAFPEGRFIRDFPGYIFYVGKNNDGKLQDVMVFKLENETNVSMTITAPNGTLEINSTNREMFLHLVQPRIIASRGQITYAPELTSPNIYPTNASVSGANQIRISDMTFWQLQDELRDLQQKLSLPLATNGTPPAELRARLREADRQRTDLTEPVRVEMNRQISFSFACFGFTLIGIPLGIRVHRRETNIGVAIALGLALVYYAFIMLAESLSARPEFAPHLILWLPDFVFQAVGAVLLWRANRGI